MNSNRGYFIPEEVDIVLGFTCVPRASGLSKRAPGWRESVAAVESTFPERHERFRQLSKCFVQALVCFSQFPWQQRGALGSANLRETRPNDPTMHEAKERGLRYLE